MISEQLLAVKRNTIPEKEKRQGGDFSIALLAFIDFEASLFLFFEQLLQIAFIQQMHSFKFTLVKYSPVIEYAGNILRFF